MILDFADARTPLVPDVKSGVFILGEPQNKKTTRQRTKQDLKIEIYPAYISSEEGFVWTNL